MVVKKVILLLAAIIAASQMQFRPLVQSHAAGERSFKSLHQLMEEGIHERFTFVSFTLWHDSPMTPEKMDAIAESALQLQQMAETIPALRPRYLEPEWAKNDRKAFDLRAAELSKVAMMLAEAATRKDKARAENLFDRLESSCQSCHAKFNKALADR